MKFRKIKALMYSDWLITSGNKGRAMESFFFPISTVIIYGLFSLFITDKSFEAGMIILIVNILWSFAYLMQGHINMLLNEEMWSGSIKQTLMTGVSGGEYILARILTSLILSLLVMIVMISMSVFLFNSTIFVTQWFAFLLIITSILIASTSLAIFIAAGTIALGHEYGFVAWSGMQVLVMLSAPFYPVSVYPFFMQPLVSIMPFTYTFEAARTVISGIPDMNIIMQSMGVSIIYLLLSIPFYIYIYKLAKKKGWLVRLG